MDEAKVEETLHSLMNFNNVKEYHNWMHSNHFIDQSDFLALVLSITEENHWSVSNMEDDYNFSIPVGKPKYESKDKFTQRHKKVSPIGFVRYLLANHSMRAFLVPKEVAISLKNRKEYILQIQQLDTYWYLTSEENFNQNIKLISCFQEWREKAMAPLEKKVNEYNDFLDSLAKVSNEINNELKKNDGKQEKDDKKDKKK